jgi:hypothetical protein
MPAQSSCAGINIPTYREGAVATGKRGGKKDFFGKQEL